ncbi:sacsin N-terminal ATP-binding-like domain-containing protein [Cellulomonas sp. URHB0016]
MTPDAFGTAALRAAVLRAWRASPARLREDANTEEDHARGYYRDRVLVELAQNAADAAARTAVPGRLLLRLVHADDGTVLVAANTGAPLDAEGVASLASMRASSKRADGRNRTVGRFGVGFAAVRAVADEVSVLSTTGGVRFSVADTAELLAQASADVPALADEVRRRDGQLPALRLPLPADGRPPAGYDTAVVLRLRDEVAADEVRGLLRDVGDPLLLGLPALVEILVEDVTSDAPPRRLADVEQRWVVASDEGELPLALLADRPVEERSARDWRVAWALPRHGTDPATRVVHAPTPTDEPSSVPALLVATLPLDPTRRHVAAGPLTDALLDHAADVYARLATDVAASGGDALALVPTGLAAGPLDGDLRTRLVDRLARTPLLRPADDPDDDGADGLVAPGNAVALVGPAGHDDRALAALGRRLAGLVRLPAGRDAQARTLGVELRPLADAVEDLPGVLDGDWRDLYDALTGLAADPQAREALGALPVPLADGRVVRGARGTLVLPGDLAGRLGPEALRTLGRWGVRVVDPDAEHPVLLRLGAEEADAAGVLAQPAVRQAVLAQADDDDLVTADEVTEAVLAVVAAVVAAGAPDDDAPPPPWLGLLTLDAADGEPTPADGLVVPGSVASRLLDDRVMTPVAVAVLERWDERTLTAVGVRADLVLVRVHDVLADPLAVDPDASDDAGLAARSLDGWEEYLAHLAGRLGGGAYLSEVTAVADLDAVADGAWSDVLARVAAVPRLRRALVEPVRGESGGTAQSYSAWWLRDRSGLGLDGPFGIGGAVAGVLPPAPDALAGLDVGVQRALGGVVSFDELDGDGWSVLLAGWGPAGLPVAPDVAVAVWSAMAPDRPPEFVPAIVGPGRVALTHAEDAAVAGAPMWCQRTDVAAVVPAADPRTVADLLDLPLVEELADGVVGGDAGETVDVPSAVLAVLPGAPATWQEHEDLLVDGTPVQWWVEGDRAGAVVHAVHVEGLAAGLAQAAGRWADRHVVELLLGDPDRAASIALDPAWRAPQQS